MFQIFSSIKVLKKCHYSFTVICHLRSVTVHLIKKKEEDVYILHLVFFSVGYSVLFVRKLMQVSVEILTAVQTVTVYQLCFSLCVVKGLS